MKEWTIEKMKLSELQEADYNPRAITDRAKAGLKTSMERFGFVEPIVWNKRTGTVVGGHQRLQILRESGAKEASVCVVDFDEIDEKALNLTLNNPEIQGDFDELAEDLLEAIKSEMPKDFEGFFSVNSVTFSFYLRYNIKQTENDNEPMDRL